MYELQLQSRCWCMKKTSLHSFWLSFEWKTELTRSWILNAENKEENRDWISSAKLIHVLNEWYDDVCEENDEWAFWKMRRAMMSLRNEKATKMLKMSDF